MPTFIEVCAGAGGMSCGFIRAGFTPILLNELDKTCCQTLTKNHPNISISQCDVTKLDLTQHSNKVDMLIGGVPCQSFSQAGKQAGLQDARGNLMYTFEKLIRQCNPRIWIIENVRGLVSHEKGATFSTLIDLFKSNTNYNIEWKILNSKDYGVAQKRERIFIVGTLKLLPKFNFPDSIKPEIFLRDILINVPESAGSKYSAKKYEIMKMIPPGGCWINLPPKLQQEYMGESLNSGGGKRGCARRLSMDEQCLTLTTSPDQKQTTRCHPIETRPFTTREYARIQSFPDTYQFCGSTTSIYKQIGNAVPVNMAFHVAQACKKIL